MNDAPSAGSETKFLDSGRQGSQYDGEKKKFAQDERYNVYHGEPENGTYKNTTDEALEERSTVDSISPQTYGTEKISPEASFIAPEEQYGNRADHIVDTDPRYTVSSEGRDSDFTDSVYASNKEPKTYEVVDSERKIADESIVPKQDVGMGVSAMNDDVQEPPCTQYGRESDYKEPGLVGKNYDEPKLEEQNLSTPMADSYNEKEREPEKHEGLMEKLKETLFPCHNTPTKDDEDEDLRKQSAQEAPKSHGFVDKVKEKLSGKPQAEPADIKEGDLQAPDEAPKKGLLGKIKDKLYSSP